ADRTRRRADDRQRAAPCRFSPALRACPARPRRARRRGCSDARNRRGRAARRRSDAMNADTPRWDGLLPDVQLATLRDGIEAPYGAIEDGALGWKDGRLVFAGARAELPGAPQWLAERVESGQGDWVTPGLVDCHTHLVFGGERAGEFEQRLQGASYEQIARAG